MRRHPLAIGSVFLIAALLLGASPPVRAMSQFGAPLAAVRDQEQDTAADAPDETDPATTTDARGSDDGNAADRQASDSAEAGGDEDSGDAVTEASASAFATLAEAEAAWLAASRQDLPPAVNVRGIYVRDATLGTPRLDELIALVDRTELNSMVVDVKSDWGPLTYRSTNPLAIDLGEQGGAVPDLGALIGRLHQHKMYVIGRLVVFKDHTLARSRPEWMLKNTAGGVWTGYGGGTWIDPTNRSAWRYLVSIGKEAAAAGIDEIQFDYVRFPSDGPVEQLVYPAMGGRSKGQVIAEFLAYARKQLHPYGVRVSADVFGLVTSVRDDMGIGQHLEGVAAGVDYLSPMTYPSHYAGGNLGVAWPNNAPYTILRHSLGDAIGRLKAAGLTGVQVRPWLQDFTYGNAGNPAVTYGPPQVRAQIQATYDAGARSWMLWNAANVYTEGALHPKGQ